MSVRNLRLYPMIGRGCLRIFPIPGAGPPAFFLNSYSRPYCHILLPRWPPGVPHLPSPGHRLSNRDRVRIFHPSCQQPCLGRHLTVIAGTQVGFTFDVFTPLGSGPPPNQQETQGSEPPKYSVFMRRHKTAAGKGVATDFHRQSLLFPRNGWRTYSGSGPPINEFWCGLRFTGLRRSRIAHLTRTPDSDRGTYFPKLGWFDCFRSGVGLSSLRPRTWCLAIVAVFSL